MTATPLDRARVLTEALPYIKRYHGKTVVVKYGGAAMEDPELRERFAADVVLLRYVGVNPVVVHGGGPQVTAVVERLGGTARFVDGYRVTDADDLRAARMVLCGVVNKDIVTSITRQGMPATGLSGEDGGLMRVRRKTASVDLGFVGEVIGVQPAVVERLLGAFIPVVATVGVDDGGQAHNVNADEAAAALARALHAEKLVFLTDVEGILDGAGRVLPRVRAPDVERLRADGGISAGMLPKVQAALRAIDGGVPKVTILDGRAEHALLLEMFTEEGVGTMVTA